MDADLRNAYAEIEHDIREAVKKNRGNRSLMSLMMHRLLLYPDHPLLVLGRSGASGLTQQSGVMSISW
jgi:hypothetical protein